MASTKIISLIVLFLTLGLSGLHFAVVGVYHQSVKDNFYLNLPNVNISTPSPYDYVLVGAIVSAVLSMVLIFLFLSDHHNRKIKLFFLTLLIMFEFAIGIVLSIIVKDYTDNATKDFLTDDAKRQRRIIIADIVLTFVVLLVGLMYVFYDLVNQWDHTKTSHNEDPPVTAERFA